MDGRLTTVERAYQLAASGKCRTLEDVVRQLKSEGFASVEAHMAGASIRKDLRQRCRDAIR